MLRGLLILACAVLALSGCGSTEHAATTAPKQCAAAPKAIAKLYADITAMKRAAALPTANTLQGNKAVNAATDRFLNDVALAPIDNKRRNRMIDHAAGVLSGACEQCFQALEAARPIPAIAHGARCG